MRAPRASLLPVTCGLLLASAAFSANACGDSSSSGALPVADAGGDTSDDAAPLPGRFPGAGVTTRTLVDATRPTPANGTAAAQSSRTLVTEIWYPTTATDDTPVRDAPVAPGGPYPLVFFVHGSSSGRSTYTYLTAALARAGYIVAAADFPLTALVTPGGASDLGVWHQVGDLSFLCDRLAAASADAHDALVGAIDAKGYAVVGHSTGGAVAELAAFAGDDGMIKHDPRVKAIVPLSGDACMFDADFFRTRSVPVFVIGASNDLFVRYPNSGGWVFQSTGEPHLSAELMGGQHVYFTDITFLTDAVLGPVPTGPTSDLAVTLRAYGDAGACLPEPAPGTDPPMPAATQHAYVVKLVTAYLDAQMRGDPSPLAALKAAKDPLIVFRE